jgi:hypothetical protein
MPNGSVSPPTFVTNASPPSSWSKSKLNIKLETFTVSGLLSNTRPYTSEDTQSLL